MDGIFTIRHQAPDCAARTGCLTLAHGTVETPVFMPVGTAGTVKALSNENLTSIGFDIILGNTYHLFLRPGTDVIERAGGLHEFSGWRRNILTDSGGFQVFSLAQLCAISAEGARFRSHIDGSLCSLTPERAAEIQCVLNSDIQMQLDVCTEAGAEEARVREALEISGAWLARAKAVWLRKKDAGYKGALFSIVQGGFDRHLRRQSAELCALAETPGIAIGGLSVGEEAAAFCDFLAYTAALLPREKPRYVMGIGTPHYILHAIEHGIDMFDCVLPTRVARNGRALTSRGALSVKKEQYKFDMRPLDTSCGCPVCAQHSRSYIRHLFKSGEILSAMLLSYHNLFFMRQLVLNARRAIVRGDFLAYKKDFLSLYDGGVDDAL